MTTPDASPPQWAERLLRVLLAPADRDTITGDLLEEYREVIRPTRGPIGARCWYVKNAASLILFSHTLAQWAIRLTAATILALAFFKRHDVEPPFPTGAWTLLAILASATFSLRPAEFGFLWRASFALGGLLSAVAMIASAVASPRTPELVVVSCYAMVFLAAGFVGARRAHRVGTGILAAAATGAVAATVWLALVTTISAIFPSVLNQFGPPIAGFNRPSMVSLLVHSVNNHLMLIMFAIVPGGIGAMFGRALGSLLDRSATRFERVAN